MLVVVGGHSRNIGKTSVISGLIDATPEANWTAIKITQYGHGLCSDGGVPCDCTVETPDHPYAITEEIPTADPSTDSARFLAAGAARAYWLRTAQGKLAEAMPALRVILASAQNSIVESNTLLKFLRPDLYLAVLNPEIADFKPSALEALDRAAAIILTGNGPPRWTHVSPRLYQSKPHFPAPPPTYRNVGLDNFVRTSLDILSNRPNP